MIHKSVMQAVEQVGQPYCCVCYSLRWPCNVSTNTAVSSQLFPGSMRSLQPWGWLTAAGTFKCIPTNASTHLNRHWHWHMHNLCGCLVADSKSDCTRLTACGIISPCNCNLECITAFPKPSLCPLPVPSLLQVLPCAL